MNSAIRKTAVRAGVFKVVQGLECCAVLVQPEHRALTQRPIVEGRAIEYTIASLDETGVGVAVIRQCGVEAVQHRIAGAVFVEPENRAAIVRAAGERAAVEPAIAALDNAVERISAFVGVSGEATDDGEAGPVGCQAEDRPGIHCPAMPRCAIEPSVASEDDPAPR